MKKITLFLLGLATIHISKAQTSTMINGTGTKDRVPKFTSANKITNSQIIDNGKVGINTLNPTATLTVNGTGKFTDTVTVTTLANSDSSNRAASTAFVKRNVSGGYFNTITNGPLITIATNSVQNWAIWQPSNYGQVYNDLPVDINRMDRWYSGYATFPGVNTSSRPNNVWYQGYNATPAGGRINVHDAGFQFRHETHFENIEGPLFEFHIPELFRTDGVMQRLFSIYANKQFGGAYIQSAVNSHSWFDPNNAFQEYAKIQKDGLRMYNINSGGTLNLVMGDDFGNNTLYLSNSGGNGSLSLLRPLGGTIKTKFNFSGVDKMDFVNGTAVKNIGTILLGENSLINDLYDTIHPSAQFEIRSAVKGFLPPRMSTTNKNLINSPAEGLMIYDNTTRSPQYFDGINWKNLSGLNVTTTGTTGPATYNSSTGTLNVPQYSSTSQWVTSSNDISYTTGNVGVGTASPAAKLSVYSANVADQLDIDGNNYPAIKLKYAGVTKGHIFIDGGNGYFLNANSGDIGIAVSGVGGSNNILLGRRGTSANVDALVTIGDKVGINTGTTTIPSSLLFDVQSTDKGARPIPQMTTAQRNAISSPVNGMQIFNINSGTINAFFSAGNTWVEYTGVKKGTTTFIFNGVQSVFTIPHTIGYTPSSINLTFSDGNNTLFATSTRTIDNTDITITCSAPPASGSITVYWQAFN